MVTFIEVTNGVYQGHRFQAVEGLTIGRAGADIIIQDPKISSVHAQFVTDAKGRLILLDLNSSNGIHIGHRRVKKVALISGVSFELGRTQFRVFEIEESEIINVSKIITWRRNLRDRLASMNLKELKPSQTIASFNPAVKLMFIQGIQTDQEIILGYGPRSAGSKSLDIELLDELAPPEAFELHPQSGLVQLKILAPGRVTLNNKSIDSETLKDGDLISTGNTVIKVLYF